MTDGLTVLTHVRNEELLMPHWLRHHLSLFDHGVIVDRGSTDRTLAIVRELAPDWEIVTSRNLVFDARACDREMMELESLYFLAAHEAPAERWRRKGSQRSPSIRKPAP